MKKTLLQTVICSSFALLSSAAVAQITNTPHNLTSTGTGPNKQSTTDQICVFCHTPHGSSTVTAAPLWNKNLPADGSGYTTYSDNNSSTIDGTILTVGSVSLACLSCHDGTQAMDSMFNAPGRGAGVGATVTQGYTWTAGAATISATGIANLGEDLSNDHPIGIQYCGGGITATGGVKSGTCNDGDFVGSTGNDPTWLRADEINSQQVFWVNTGSDDAIRSSTDIILYTRTFGGVTGPSVECASCHDPHKAGGVTGDGGAVHFMRVTNTGSQICLACHVK